MYYTIATVEGLHLTCDFVVHSAALYGCPPNYNSTSAGQHETYRQPYEVLGSVPFGDYLRFSSLLSIDELTLQALVVVPSGTLKDFTCVAFEIGLENPAYASVLDVQTEESLLQKVIERGERGERILDIIRLFLFKPGGSESIGRVGGIGSGVSGVWLGDDGRHAKFIARRVSRYQLTQNPVEMNLTDVRRIYNDPVFRELCSAASLDHEHDYLLNRIFQSLRTFRESRDIQSLEARFQRLAAIAEHLAKRDEKERLVGRQLRDRIAQIANNGWLEKPEALAVTTDLWDNVRNPLTHSVETFCSISRDPERDIRQIEAIVVGMIQAVVIAWRDEQFGMDPYDSLLGS